jgi:hypothetical protein
LLLPSLFAQAAAEEDLRPVKTGHQNPEAVAVVIGISKYQHRDVPPVEFAVNDVEAVKRMLIETLGYQESRVFLRTDSGVSLANDRYRKMAESILRESQGLDVELSVVKTEGPLIGLSGPPEAIEKALKKILGDFALPPETKIVLPGKYTEYNGSSETGYAIARKVVTEMGHRLKRSGEILRRSFKLKPNA